MMDRSLCSVVAFHLYFIVLYISRTSFSNKLECSTDQLDDIAKVNCTAVLYRAENCSETFLSQKYTHLYWKDDFPGRPCDLILRPIQKLYKSNKKYYPGFEAALRPPKTYDIKAVQGFQLDYSDEREGKRCIVIQIINTSLSSVHRDNELKLKVDIYPVTQFTDFTFIASSLPTPRTEQKEVQIRHGRSGVFGWGENTPSASWITTISYYVNTEEKYIDFRFAPAPTKYNFTSYDIALSRLLANEGQSTEVRDTTGLFTINTTKYTFSKLIPGRYRVEVSPHDGGNAPNCKCKNSLNLCDSCTKTVTSIIDIPTDGGTPIASYSSSMTTLSGKPTPLYMTTEESAVLPSILGILSFILVVIVIVGCYIFNKNRLHDMLNDKQQATAQVLNNQMLHSSSKDQKHHSGFGQKTKCEFLTYGQQIITEKRVAIIAADDSEHHQKVVSTFATYLQRQCHCNVLYYPWNSLEDKFRWIANSIEQADFNVFVISESAFNQYDAWKHKKPTSSKDMFIPYLTSVLNRFVNNPNFFQRFMLVKFDHSINISMPDVCTSHYQLLKDFTEFLSHIHGLNAFKDDLQKVDLPIDQDLTKTKEGRDLNNAIHHAVKMHRPKPSRFDSGYNSHNENSNSFNEEDWREVRQKYVLSEIIQEKPPGEVFGAFLIDEESRSLMPGQAVEIASIAPAITIAEGGAGEYAFTLDINPNQSSLMALNKFGEHIKPNIYPSSTVENISLKEDSQTNESNSKQGGRLNEAFIINKDELLTCYRPDTSYTFIPPEPSMLDEDITTQYQFEIMQDINQTYLRSTTQDTDNISGYSV